MIKLLTASRRYAEAKLRVGLHITEGLLHCGAVLTHKSQAAGIQLCHNMATVIIRNFGLGKVDSPAAANATDRIYLIQRFAANTTDFFHLFFSVSL